MGPKWQAYQDASNRRQAVEAWLKHIGADGRSYNGKTERLRLSLAHSNVKLVVSGQYHDGGQNYWDSPEPFNKLLMDVIHDNFSEIREEVLKRLKAIESASLIEAKAEVKAVLSDIEKAESEAV